MNSIIDDFIETNIQKKANIFNLVNNSADNPEWQSNKNLKDFKKCRHTLTI
jgi:hypothetical protein